jgi:hypothetical protein
MDSYIVRIYRNANTGGRVPAAREPVGVVVSVQDDGRERAFHSRAELLALLLESKADLPNPRQRRVSDP